MSMLNTKNRPTTNRILSLIAATAIVTLGLSGCTGSEPAPSASASPAAAVEIADTPLGEATKWALAILQGDTEVTEAEIEERVAPETIAQIGGAPAFVTTFQQLQALAPYEVVAYEESDGIAGTRVETTADGAAYLLSVSVDEAGLITALTLQAAPEIPEPAADWDELEERTDEIGAPVSVAVFDVSEGDVGKPTFSAGDLEGAQPSGSMFKLFVLLAVVDAVDQGTLAWDDTLTLTPATRSLPSGELQQEPNGTEVTVEEAALGMISISDNTATDLLIEAVGQASVEAQIAEHAPDGADATTPMLTTRAFFQIGWGDEAMRAEWAAADDSGRAAVLADAAEAALTATGSDVTVPVWQDDVDWFFSAADLARAHVALQEAATTDAGAPLADILTANPGLESADDWDSVAFKGGSSIGVQGVSWMLQKGDAAYVVVVQSATESEGEYLAQRSALYLGTNAAELLAEK